MLTIHELTRLLRPLHTGNKECFSSRDDLSS